MVNMALGLRTLNKTSSDSHKYEEYTARVSTRYSQGSHQMSVIS